VAGILRVVEQVVEAAFFGEGIGDVERAMAQGGRLAVHMVRRAGARKDGVPMAVVHRQRGGEASLHLLAVIVRRNASSAPVKEQ
jgi:hypothetical protein